MLSAVQARKNRLLLQDASPVSQPTSPSPVPSSKSTGPTVKGSFKRKASNVGITPRKKKSRPARAASRSKDSRYFQSQANDDDTPDVIVVDDEDTNSLIFSSDDSSTGSTSPLPRAWSPSEHIAAEMGDGVMMEDDFFATPAQNPANAPTVDVSALSTFKPVNGKNLFPLSPEEMRELGVHHRTTDINACIVLFSPHETLALVGTYKLRVLRGLITLAGVTLDTSFSSHSVFAPRCAPIPVMQSPTQGDGALADVTVLPGRLRAASDAYSTAVLLTESRTGVESLGKVVRTFDDVFNPLRSRGAASEPQLGLRGVHIVTIPHHGVYTYSLPDSWDGALSSSVPSPALETDYSRKVFFVKGAKKSGKSTFARTLLNRLSTQYRFVAFLECDLGQSEFTPGGLVALNIVSSPIFGPPFTHPSLPYQAHYIGSTTPQSSPSRYIVAIETLIHTYNTDLQHASPNAQHSQNDRRIDDFIPLVVNMMGWTKGLGADLSDRVEEMLQPSAVFEFEAPAYDDGWTTPAPYRREAPPMYEVSSFATQVYPVHRLPPAIVPSAVLGRYSPADLRQLSVLSYFHAVFGTGQVDSIESVLAQSWDTSLPLCAKAPYELSCDSALDFVALVGPGSEDVVASEVHRVLNGAIVAWVSYETGTSDIELGAITHAAIPYIPGTPPPEATTSTCHGLALIRSISPSLTSPTLLHMLTPVPSQILTKSQPRVLVKGEMELPIWGMLDFRSETHIAGMNKIDVPYLKWGTTTEAVGATKRRARRNLMRKGQM